MDDPLSFLAEAPGKKRFTARSPMTSVPFHRFTTLLDGKIVFGWIAATMIGCFAIGWYAGREHLIYQIKNAVSDATAAFDKQTSSALRRINEINHSPPKPGQSIK